jgi:hypothetical protein
VQKREEEMKRYLLAALASAALMVPVVASANGTMGNDYRVRIINRSDYVVTGVYATNRDEYEWDVNLLEEDLYPGDSVTIDLDDYSGYCKYDMKADGDNGGEWTRYNINVCRLHNWILE